MNHAFERYYDLQDEPLDITSGELVDLLDAGLGPTEIDRLRFTRWRLQTRQLAGDGWRQSTGDDAGEVRLQVRSAKPSEQP